MATKKDNIPEFTEAVKVVFDALKGIDYKISADHVSNTDESVDDSNHHLTVTVKSKIRISIATDGRILMTFPSNIRQSLIAILNILKLKIDSEKIAVLKSDNKRCHIWISKDEIKNFNKLFISIYLLA